MKIIDQYTDLPLTCEQKFRLRHPEKIKEISKKHHLKYKEEINERKRKYYKENPEKRKEEHRKDYEKHLERAKNYTKIWNQKNPERKKQNSKKWNDEHPKERRESSVKRHQNLEFEILWKPEVLNKTIEYEYHHINIKYVVQIPEKLHRSIKHNIHTGYNMDVINNLAFNYVINQSRYQYD